MTDFRAALWEFTREWWPQLLVIKVVTAAWVLATGSVLWPMAVSVAMNVGILVAVHRRAVKQRKRRMPRSHRTNT